MSEQTKRKQGLVLSVPPESASCYYAVFVTRKTSVSIRTRLIRRIYDILIELLQKHSLHNINCKKNKLPK